MTATHTESTTGNAPQGESSDGPGPRPWRLALAQIAPLLGRPDDNLALHLENIAAARRDGADLIVFPELSLTGYFLRDMVPEVALAVDAPPLDQLAEGAGPMSLVYGFVEEAEGHRFYNAAAYVEDGYPRHVHRKVYLPTYGLFDEARYFARGDRVRAFDTKAFGRVGLVVCEDFWHLSVATIMQAEGVDLLICIANSPARGVGGETIETADTYLRLGQTFAQLLGAVLVLVNRVGFEDGLCFWGGSMVIGPDADILAQAPLFDETLLTATIDPAEIRRQRTITPLGRDEQLLLTLEELERIRQTRYEE